MTHKQITTMARVLVDMHELNKELELACIAYVSHCKAVRANNRAIESLQGV